MSDTLTKMQIAQELEDRGLGRKRQIANILDGLAELAQGEIAEGYDFTVPGIARITWRYTKPQAKGARWKKGEERTKFGGVVEVAESDSPEVKARVELKAALMPKLKGLAPKKSDKAAQRNFLSKKVGKNIADRKG